MSDHTVQFHAPVLVEGSPMYLNLFGTIEGSAIQVMLCPEYVAKSSGDSAYCRLTFARQHYLDTTTLACFIRETG